LDADNLPAGAEPSQPNGRVKKYFEKGCISAEIIIVETGSSTDGVAEPASAEEFV